MGLLRHVLVREDRRLLALLHAAGASRDTTFFSVRVIPHERDGTSARRLQYFNHRARDIFTLNDSFLLAQFSPSWLRTELGLVRCC